MNNWHRYADSNALDSALAAHIAERLRADIARAGRATLAVSGGRTPVGLFRQLARCELDWASVWVTLADERMVPADSSDSNARLVREHLLQDSAARARLVSLANEDGSVELAELERRLAALPSPFSATVLGMGEDGHTASWFPGASNLDQLLDPTGTVPVAVTAPVAAAHRRITLTLSRVLRSREIILHVTGQRKKAVLDEALQRDYPVAAIFRQHATPVTIWWAP